jgi:hypothetical protein
MIENGIAETNLHDPGRSIETDGQRFGEEGYGVGDGSEEQVRWKFTILFIKCYRILKVNDV